MATCECGTDIITIIYTVLLAAALAATAYYLGRRSAQAGLHARGDGRGLKAESPGEEAKQEEDAQEPLLPVVASDDEGETTVRGSEGGRSSWSVIDETLGARPRATGRTSTRTVLVQSPVTYLRKRAQPRFQPLPDVLWGALVTAESLGDG